MGTPRFLFQSDSMNLGWPRLLATGAAKLSEVARTLANVHAEVMSNKRIIIDDEHFAHFITFSCDGRRSLLDHDQPKQILLDVLDQQLSRHNAKCIGFIVMPNHVHAIVWFSQTQQLSRFLHEWKRRSSYEIRKWYRTQNFNYFKITTDRGRFWTPKYYSFEIYSAMKLEEKLQYMHLNPVRAGLVDTAVDWKWSSARWYELQEAVGVPIDWVE